MANPLIQFRTNLKAAIVKRAKLLGFDDVGDYLNQIARNEIAASGMTGPMTITAARVEIIQGEAPPSGLHEVESNQSAMGLQRPAPAKRKRKSPTPKRQSQHEKGGQT